MARSTAFFDEFVKCFGKKVGDFNKKGIRKPYRIRLKIPRDYFFRGG